MKVYILGWDGYTRSFGKRVDTKDRLLSFRLSDKGGILHLYKGRMRTSVLPHLELPIKSLKDIL